MKSKPLISVLLPVYNGERFINKSIESILQQDFKDFELILVNDGSTDKTQKIIEKYQIMDSRVVIINQKNKGIVKALNAGLWNSKGKYCARMDADDISKKDRLSLQFNYLENHSKTVVVGGHAYIIDEDGDYICPLNVELEDKDINALLLRDKKYNGKFALIHPTTMFRLEVAKKIGGYKNEYIWAEDRDFFLRMGEKGRLENLDNVLIYYRKHGCSVSDKRARDQEFNAQKAITSAKIRRNLPASTINENEYQATVSIFNSDYSIFLAINAANNNNIRSAFKHTINAILNDITKLASLKLYWILILLIFPKKIVKILRFIRGGSRV